MKNKKGRILIGLGLLLIAAAGLLAAYNLYDDFRAKDASQQSVGYLKEIILSGGADQLAAEQYVPTGPGSVSTTAPETKFITAPVQADQIGTLDGDSARFASTPIPVAPGTEILSPASSDPAPVEASADPADPTGQTAMHTPDPTSADSSVLQTPAPSMPTDLDAEIVKMLQEGEVPDYILNPEMEMPVISYEGQDYIGVLEIPTLELKIPIISQWNYARLRIAPCRYAGSAYTNNLVISAHNYQAHFGSLKKLDGGERVIFTDADGNRFDYIVELQETLSPRDIEGMIDAGWDLTLFTCTLGGSYRLAVRCTMIPAVS